MNYNNTEKSIDDILYSIEEVHYWEDDIPYDELGYALRPGELYDGDYNPVQDRDSARFAREATNPDGKLDFSIGSKDEFICMDYCILDDYYVVLHSVVNSESGGFLEEFEYNIVDIKTAPAAALDMTERALEWIKEHNVEHDYEELDQDPYYFWRVICRECEGRIFEDLRFGDEI